MIQNPAIQGGGGEPEWKTGTFLMTQSRKMSRGSIEIARKKGQSIAITSSSNNVTESYAYIVRENLFFGGNVADLDGKVGLITDTSVRIDLTNASGVEGEFEYFFVVF